MSARCLHGIAPWIWAFALSAGAGAVQDQPSGAIGTFLAGSWRLDSERSDDPRAKLSEATRSKHGGGRRGGGFGAPGAEPDELLEMLRAPRILHIEQGNLTITFRPEWQPSRTLELSGKKRELNTPVGRLECSAHWDGSSLVVKSKSDRIQVEEVYQLGDGNNTLTVQVTFDGPLGKIGLRHVYQRE